MNIKRYFFIFAFSWSLLMLVIIGFEIYHNNSVSEDLALIGAKTALAKDLIYRKWLSSKGGVYAPVEKNTPPNPYLHVPEKNITTPSGKKLTLVNPAYMVRQVYEMELKEENRRSHITSLAPIRPQNKPDIWEEMVLQKLEQKGEEYFEQIDIEGQPYLRYMKELTVRHSCLQCHASQGYKEGDVRGGISVTLPMSAIKTVVLNRTIRANLILLLVWLFGLGGFFYGNYHIQRQLKKQKKIEGELKKFKQTLDQTNDCVFMFLPKTMQFFYVNQGAIDQLGYLREELLTMTPLDIKPLFTEQSFQQLAEPLFENPGSSKTFETLHRHKDGHDIPVEIQMQYVVIGEKHGRFVAVVRDLTKRREAEAEKEMLQSKQYETNRQLRVSEEKHRTIIENMQDVFYRSDIQGKLILISPSGVRLLGYESKEELLGRDITFLYKEPNDRKGFFKELKNCNGRITNYELNFIRKDGTTFPVIVSGAFYFDGEGKPAGVEGTFSDITDRKQLENTLLHTSKLESVGKLAAGIAHEINTPTQFLNTNIDFFDESFQDVKSLIQKYQNFVQSVKDGRSGPELLTDLEQSEEDLDWEYLKEEIPLSIKQSLEGVARISNIVRAMKEFSHPGTKDKTPANINDIINTTITVASNEWKYVAEIDRDLAPNLPSVVCLVDEMGQVFLNILVNSAHAISDKLSDTPEDEKGLISISSRLDGKWIEVRIRDNGKGMPDSVKTHIFDPFFTTKEVGKGTGQGLSIAYSVVTDKHQGSLICESEEGVGTSFIIRLPIAV